MRHNFGKRNQAVVSSKVILLLAFLTQSISAYIECAAGCRMCWSADESNCMACLATHYLKNFKCYEFGADGTPGSWDCGSTMTLDPYDNICKAVITDVQYACEPAFYLSFQGAYLKSQCSKGLPGKAYEVWGRATQSATCDAGHYCNQYSTLRSPVDSYESITIETSYQPRSADTSTPVPNYWLKKASEGSTKRGDYCQHGTYCPAGSLQETDCSPGYYCPNHRQSSVDLVNNICRKGFYCSGGANINTPNNCLSASNCFNTDTTTGNQCPSGYYCEDGSSVQSACPAGTFVNSRQSTTPDECDSCPHGYYCPNRGQSDYTLECDPGYYCTGGASSGKQNPCPLDSKCVGVLQPQPCDSGYYTAGTRQSTCLQCSDGMICEGQGAEVPCPEGTFCTADFLTYCPPGEKAISGVTGAGDQATACEACPEYFSCRQANVVTNCDPGHVCTGNSITDRPNGPYKTTTTSGSQVNYDGYICKPGEYCPVQMTLNSVILTEPQTCDSGKYCILYAGAAVTGNCYAGYYCNTGSSDPKQFKCPAGHYCTEGTTKKKCPVGTYNEGTGAKQKQDCKECPEGAYCLSEGMSIIPEGIGTASPNLGSVGSGCESTPGTTCFEWCSPTEDCLGANKKRDCQEGYFCPGGYHSPLRCFAGWYTNVKAQSACTKCAAGNYCLWDNPSQTGTTCPRGRYCTPETTHADQHPCPAGTYNSQTARTLESQCTECDLGYYCPFRGQTSSTLSLYEGYHGNYETGHKIPDPYLCPQGFYCPEGSDDMNPCPDGKWTSTRGITSKGDCISCPRGMFCKFETMFNNRASNGFNSFREQADIEFKQFFVESTAGKKSLVDHFAGIGDYWGACDDGYICEEGATSPTPTSISTDGGYECEPGYYCPSGTLIQIPCEPGTYNPNTKQPTCLQCPEKYYCPEFAMTDPILCLNAYYCSGLSSDGITPEGNIFGMPCPAGRYGDPLGIIPEGRAVAEECEICPDMMYCEEVGLTQDNGPCAQGFRCVEGSERPGPFATVYSANTQSGKCNKGTFCAYGEDQVDCPQKYYTTNYQQSECLECPPGSYCTGGQSIETCSAGYYCNELSSVPAPTDDVQGNICPIYHYCQSGFGQPIKCPDGLQQKLEGKSTCDACDAGRICRYGQDYVNCTTNHWCNDETYGSYQFGRLCYNGFYAYDEDVDGFDRAENCTACPQGSFCKGSKIVSDCAAGYICITEADSHTPTDEDLERDKKAYACPYNYYCEEGATEPTLCPTATYTFDQAAKQETECTMCQMGYYCDLEQEKPQDCPYGSYCPFSSQEPIECPVGTFNPTMNGGIIVDCQPCRAGYYCNETGIGNVRKERDRYGCPPGHYCPRGIGLKPYPCPAGSYLDNISDTKSLTSFDQAYVGSESTASDVKSCSLCPRGYFCPTGTGFRYANPCTPGHICPYGSGAPLKCPPGFYCEGHGGKEQEICPRGYFCPMGTEAPFRCPPEAVCDEGSSSPVQRGMTAEDCEPGTYLNVDRCYPCEPGHVCDKFTSEKYPIDSLKEGGYECPPGYYCPGGTMTSTLKKCPVGTFRMEVGAKSIDDCLPCPDGSSQSREGQRVCVLCGRGSSHSEDRSTCICLGAFRTWQESTNSCVCMKGYFDPVITVDSQTSTQDLDCRPNLTPVCLPGQFVNELNECQSKSDCEEDNYCGEGQPGFFDDSLQACFCQNVPSDPLFYCDEACLKSVLRAYLTKDNQILLRAGGKARTFDPEVFGDQLFIGGMSCPVQECQIKAQRNVNGQLISTEEAADIFIKHWLSRVDPFYKSPYGTQARQLNEGNSTETTTLFRDLQAASATAIEQSIQCIQPFDAVSFDVQIDHYPVYVKDSIYNTDPNYDFGAFSILENKLQKSQLAIKSFMVTFSYEGVFAFGDSATPQTLQTLVLVRENIEDCQGSSSWALTATNMQKLGVIINSQPMKEFDTWLHFIPPFFIILAFFMTYIQNMIEQRIENRELEAKMKREKASQAMKKYYKKREDKFDKVSFLADMYKLIQQNLAEIKKKIAEHDKLVDEDEADNINKLLKDKYDLMNTVGKNQDLVEVQQKIKTMLENLRFNDGRTLQEVVQQQQIQKQLKEEEDKLAQIKAEAEANPDQNLSDSFGSEKLSSEKDDSFMEDIQEDGIGTEDENDKDEGEELAKKNPDLADDLIQQRADLRRKKEEFIAKLDPSLTQEERDLMIKNYDLNMQNIIKALQKEQEEADDKLKARLNARNRHSKNIQKQTNEKVQDKQTAIQEVQDQIDKIQEQKEKLEDKGINTKKLKEERDGEYQKKLDDFDKERDKKITTMREDFMERIKKAKDPAEKQRLLEEMGKRLKNVENELAEERKRQEANLMKLIKARQKKNQANQVKELNKQQNKLEEEINKIQREVEAQKARIYADEGASGLVDNQIAAKKEKIVQILEDKFRKFGNELTLQEREDLNTHKAQLDLERDRELIGAEAQIDQDLATSNESKMIEEEKKALRAKLENPDVNSEEKNELISQLNKLEKEAIRQREADAKVGERVLEERKKKRAQLLQIKKMEIECKQLKDLNEKEIETLNLKFIKQIDSMEKMCEKALDSEIRLITSHSGTGKEQALIVVNETHDDLLRRKLKILISRQFDDLTKYLGTMSNQVAMEHMIRTRKIQVQFEQDKEFAIAQGLSPEKLEQKIAQLAAKRDFDIEKSQEQMDRDRVELESNLRQDLEDKFCEEKKNFVSSAGEQKAKKLKKVMEKMPNDALVQQVGTRLIERITFTTKEEKMEADKNKEEKVEKARLKMIADNEQELADLQVNLNKKMETEKAKLEEQMKAKKDEILLLKKKNLEDRIKMAGDINQDQISELKAQYDREFTNVQKAIDEEKIKQINNMRSALLNRRIAQERARRLKAEKEEADRERERIEKMKAEEAQAFRTRVQMTREGKGDQDPEGLKALQVVEGDDKLRARLAAWQRAVDDSRQIKGGDDSLIWALEAKKEAEREEKARLRREKELAKLEKEKQIAFTIQELYKRVLRVEKISEVVRDQGKDFQLPNFELLSQK